MMGETCWIGNVLQRTLTAGDADAQQTCIDVYPDDISSTDGASRSNSCDLTYQSSSATDEISLEELNADKVARL